MSTGLIIAVIVIVAIAVVAAAAVLFLTARGTRGGQGLESRFGPEYERTVARHDGDTEAADRELTERLKRYGSLHERPLEAAEQERYTARWTAAQERFVDSPREAVSEADRLLAELAGARGYPDGGRSEEQLDALSVYHADHLGGYRRLHQVAGAPAQGAAGSRAGTEEMRAAMLDARVLFEDLVTPSRGRQSSGPTAKTPRHAAHRTQGRFHLPWAFHRQHVKGS
ncbi:hypothetical protein ACFOZ0_25725 [Streptomyces yaanensis]|uniref:Secreted protein n=1 Tax=Streptomyces yaanensis TaxID=1142239 RepID=A0ABV7SJZ4_9ACTN|nr:hypothetical protein [Streptomyces sp. CGMCC 4.7035]WNC01586.1 hypothetical protein Q2K21_27935 [Streptomyces sp. CGMCC 4.7035]